MQYPIRIDPLWRLWLLPFGVSRDNALAELGEKELRVRFGLAEYRIALGEIESVSLATWPIWAGVGWRTDLSGTVALIGTPSSAVDVRLRERKPIGRLGIPCERLLVTVENPERFIEALGQLLEKAKHGRGGEPRRTRSQGKRKTTSRSPSSTGRKRSKAA